MVAANAEPRAAEAATSRRRWAVASWLLLGVSLLAAALDMAHVRAGFLTEHAADLCLPAWLYIATRRLAAATPARGALVRHLGRTPETAALGLFAASAATELSQIRWPHGIFRGAFDPLDLLAFAIGLLACWAVDRGGELRRRRLA